MKSLGKYNDGIMAIIILLTKKRKGGKAYDEKKDCNIYIHSNAILQSISSLSSEGPRGNPTRIFSRDFSFISSFYYKTRRIFSSYYKICSQ